MNKQKFSPDELRKLPYLKIQDIPAVTGLSQGFVRGLIKSGTLPVVRNGRCVFVNKQLLLDTVENSLRQQMQITSREGVR